SRRRSNRSRCPARRLGNSLGLWCLPARKASSVSRLAVGQNRNLQFHKIAALSEPKPMPQNGSRIPRFPFGRFDRFPRHVRRCKFHVLAFDFHFARINFKRSLRIGVEQQIALPKSHQINPFSIPVINVPRFRRVVVVPNNSQPQQAEAPPVAKSPASCLFANLALASTKAR